MLEPWGSVPALALALESALAIGCSSSIRRTTIPAMRDPQEAGTAPPTPQGRRYCQFDEKMSRTSKPSQKNTTTGSDILVFLPSGGVRKKRRKRSLLGRFHCRRRSTSPAGAIGVSVGVRVSVSVSASAGVSVVDSVSDSGCAVRSIRRTCSQQKTDRIGRVNLVGTCL